MTFAKVIEALKSGKRVTRKQWAANAWMGASGNDLVQCSCDGLPYEYQMSWFEIDADDWEIA